ncbi:MAG: NTP transferase domain-containing protein [Lentisphaerae bacterium]|nr:NTP transferase domain-containing protein [Lentisphaerota bacterium]
MQAIILLGGQGTRLRGLFPELPKALAPVAGRPFLEWQLAWLARHGVGAVHLAAGYRAQAIQDWLAANPPCVSVTISVEPSPLGTGGGLKYIARFIGTDPFLILNGDSLLPNLDLRALVKTGRPAGSLATLAVVKAESAERYGSVEFDGENRITAFREKAAISGGGVCGAQRAINGGVYLVRQELLTRIKPDLCTSLETEVFPALCAERLLSVFLAPPPLLDMGTPQGFQAMERYHYHPIRSGF